MPENTPTFENAYDEQGYRPRPDKYYAESETSWQRRLENERPRAPIQSLPSVTSQRDPNNLNAHCQVMFDDVIGEPDGLRTHDQCWTCSISCYDYTREWCYIILTFLFAPIIACCCGINFACLSFYQIWCIGPCLRIWKIHMATLRSFWYGCLHACCSPFYETLGLIFSRFRIRYQKVPEEDSFQKSMAEQYFTV